MKKQIGMTLLSILFVQAVSVAQSPARAPTLTFDEATSYIRVRQAEEIFGRRSSTTRVVRNTVEKENLRDYIISKLEKSLPPNYRSDAEPLTQTILSSSVIRKIDPLLILAFIRQESSFRPDAVGGYGEIGLMQLKPKTAQWIAARVGILWTDESTLFDPHFNVRVGAAYLEFLRERFEKRGLEYLTAYNMGPAALRNKLKNNEMPEKYSSSLVRHYAHLYRGWIEYDTRLVASLQ